MSVGIMASGVVVSAGGIVYSDDFNRADGAPGANWNEYSVGSFLIVSNKLVRQSNTDFIDYAVAMPGADHWIEADITGAGSGQGYVVIRARTSGSLASDCLMGFLAPGANTAVIGKNNSGVYSDVATASVTNPGSAKLRLEVQGSVQRLYVDGALAVTGGDTSVTTGVIVGFNTNYPGATYDNFRCGPLPYTP